MHRWAQSLLTAIFPQPCALCQLGASAHNLAAWQAFCPQHRPQGAWLCADCLKNLTRNQQACARCALPLADAPVGALCGRCIKKSPPVDRVFAPFCYSEGMMELMRRYKYGSAYYLEPLLADLLLATVGDWQGEYDAIVPMPMHPQRWLERGFNHAEQLAKALGQHIGTPLYCQHLRRIKKTPRFASGIKRRERMRLIANSFVLDAPLPARVLVVDDVMTTGASCNEVARYLKTQGVIQVDAMVLARRG